MARIDVTIEQDTGLTLFRVRGDLTTDEAISAVKAHYRKDTTPTILWDFTEGSVDKITNDGFLEIARAVKEVREKQEGGKTAFVGVSSLDYGTLRAYQSYAEMSGVPAEYGVFRSRKAAEEWLGLGG